MPDANQIPLWYAVRTRSRHEKLVRDRLAGLGVEHLLPTVMRLSQWKDRKKEIEAPLFSGYCFAR
ncbi:MAG: transcription termination/antitermination NusG family protein, partial [Nitrospirota bacterium]